MNFLQKCSRRPGNELLNLDIANIDIESGVKPQEKGKEARMTKALNNLNGQAGLGDCVQKIVSSS